MSINMKKTVFSKPAITVLLFLVVSKGKADSCTIELTVDNDLEPPESSGSGRDCYESLQDVLTSLASSLNRSSSVTICVREGEHYLASPVQFNVEHIHIIGVDSNVAVSCNYSTSGRVNIDYTWQFNYTSSVSIHNLKFYGCPYPFRMLHVQSLSVTHCSFMFFREAVLDVFNCINVTLSHLVLENNTGTGIVPVAYRGNTGGIAIGYNGLSQNVSSPPHVNISNCILRNNSALATSRLISISATAFNQVFTGRGGALGIFVNDSYNNVCIFISNCSIENNYAKSFGGGLYTLFNGETASHSMMIDTTNISSNVAFLHGGGGMQLSFLSNGIPADPHTVIFNDCRFDNNSAEAGGGIYIFTSFLGSDGNFVRMNRCEFSNNHGMGTRSDYGAAIVISLLTIFQQRVTLPRHEIVDCEFHGNYGPNGIVSIGYAPVLFKGKNSFVENEGAALRIVGSVVDFYDELNFINNSVQDSAQLYLLSFGQVRLKHGVNVTFQGNNGSFGASILVDSPQSLDAFDKLLFNPRCFVLYSENIPPSEWTNVSVTFTDNKAILSSAVYVSRLDTCSWFNMTQPYFNATYLPNWPLWNFNNNENTGYKVSTDEAFSVGTMAKRIISSNSTVTAWPGQRLSLSITGIDQFGHSTTANARFVFEGHSDIVASVSPEILVIAPDSEDGTLQEEFTLTYSIAGGIVPSSNESLGVVTITIPFETFSVVTDSFTLYYVECPGGYTLAKSTSTGMMSCECEDVKEVLHCEDDQDSILIETGYWATKREGSSFQFFPCPPGYCGCSQRSSIGESSCVHTYTNSDPDRQCVCERKGTLCGACRDGKGVSVLLNKCVTCNNAFGILILLLIVMDVTVFIVILQLDKPIPTWIYPFLFYIQLVPYVSQYFPGNFESVGKYVYYLSSTSGFYFIYDFCLHGSMNPLVSYFLRYIPFCIAVMIRPALLVVRQLVRKYGKQMKSLQNHGLWGIVLLLYSPTVHTSMSILQCNQLKTQNGNTKLSWFINGETECFTGGHAPLALLAILVLLFVILLVPICLFLTLYETSQKVINKLNEALRPGFKDKFKWWSSIELGRRFIFLLFFMPFPGNYAGPITTLIISITIYGIAKPYKDKIANILEVVVQSCFLVLILLLSVASTQDNLLKFPSNGSGDADCNNTPAGIAGIVWLLFPLFYFPLGLFLVISGCFVAQFTWKQLIKPKMISSREQNNPENSVDECTAATAPSKTEMFIDDDAKEGTATMSRIPTVIELADVTKDNQ